MPQLVVDLLLQFDILHRAWLESYQNRGESIQPGDSLECQFEETIVYDDQQNEVERKIAVIEVLRVVSPPQQRPLLT